MKHMLPSVYSSFISLVAALPKKSVLHFSPFIHHIHHHLLNNNNNNQNIMFIILGQGNNKRPLHNGIIIIHFPGLASLIHLSPKNLYLLCPTTVGVCLHKRTRRRRRIKHIIRWSRYCCVCSVPSSVIEI